MAGYSSSFAWRIPWTEEAGGPQSIGSQSRTQLKQLNTTQTVKNACLTPLLYFQPSPFSIGFAVPITAVNKTGETRTKLRHTKSYH